MNFLTVSAIDFALFLFFKCEYLDTACAKSTISHFLFSDVQKCSRSRKLCTSRVMLIYTYISIYSAQAATFDPSAKQDC